MNSARDNPHDVKKGFEAGINAYVFKPVENIRRNADLMDIPIFMITTNTDDEFKQKAFSLGVRQYITKPFDPTEIARHMFAKLDTAYRNLDKAAVLVVDDSPMETHIIKHLLATNGYRVRAAMSGLQ